MAAQLGSRLQGACCVLDDSTVGLRLADVQKPIRVLHRLVAGVPELLVQRGTHTGKALALVLAR